MWSSLVKFGPVVSEEKIFVKVNDAGRWQTTDAKWWEKLTWPYWARWAEKGGGVPTQSKGGVPTICSHSNALIVQKKGRFWPPPLDPPLESIISLSFDHCLIAVLLGIIPDLQNIFYNSFLPNVPTQTSYLMAGHNYKRE